MTKRELKVGDRARIARWGRDYGFEHCRDKISGTEGVIMIISPTGLVHLKTDKGSRHGYISGLDPIPDPTLNDENSIGCEADEEPRITFTVGGQEFFIGQRVWNTYPEDGMFELGAELEVCGKPETGGSVFVRAAGACIIRPSLVRYLSITPPAPHEWKRGDWARHDHFGVGFVTHSPAPDAKDMILVSFEGPITQCSPLELTFIARTQIPE